MPIGNIDFKERTLQKSTKTSQCYKVEFTINSFQLNFKHLAKQHIEELKTKIGKSLIYREKDFNKAFLVNVIMNKQKCKNSLRDFVENVINITNFDLICINYCIELLQNIHLCKLKENICKIGPYTGQKAVLMISVFEILILKQKSITKKITKKILCLEIKNNFSFKENIIETIF